MKTTTLTLAALLLAACTGSDPVRVEDDFGQSVRTMVREQTAGTAPAAHPGLDGMQGEAVMKKHRATVGDPAEVRKNVEVQISN